MLACVLLAAGLSSRFGAGDKLAAMLRGEALVEAAAQSARQLSPDLLLAVTRPGGVRPDGFRCLVNERPEAGLGGSLAIGARAAFEAGADRLLVLLGDVPGVGADHLRGVAALCRPDRPSASTDGALVSPPACFPGTWLPRLAASEGDAGAGRFLRGLPPAALLRTEPATLRDVDTMQDLRDIAGEAS